MTYRTTILILVETVEENESPDPPVRDTTGEELPVELPRSSPGLARCEPASNVVPLRRAL